MRLVLTYQPATQAGASPYRLLDEENREIAWVNAFLDAQHLRQLSPRSVRAYAYVRIPGHVNNRSGLM